jgi:lipoprotein-anchoring transpeptidase ErfK/SrfK
MRSYRIFAVGLTFLAAVAAQSASAQNCDIRFPLTCLIFIDPFFQSNQPGPPLDITPDQSSPEEEDARPDEVERNVDPAITNRYAGVYASIDGEPFAIPAVRLSDIEPQYLRQTVSYSTLEQPGTIVVDPKNHFLYLVQARGRAVRYGVGVGRQGFGWSGVAAIHNKQEWPDWYPPKEMIERQPELKRQMSELQSGLGMAGGSRNPLGSRAMYLWEGNKDTLYRIHGTVEPWTIGKSVSSGCIRMLNQDVIDLYQQASIGTKVVVLPAR